MNGDGDGTCLVTVTDDKYVTGTLVMLSSFLAQNAWFEGDIVIVHDGLSDSVQARLTQIPRVRFRQIGRELRRRVSKVTDAIPTMRRKAAIFSAIEAFALSDYDRVLKLDGDVLCTGDASELFDGDEALRACPDRFYYRYMRRERRTYLPAPENASGDLLPVTFNPGVMMISPSRLPASTYPNLVDLVQPQAWDGVRTGHTDSIVLNRFFEGRWTQLPERFNYFVVEEAVGRCRPRVPIEEAVFLHFLQRPKPWEARARTAAGDTARALEAWDEAAAQAGGPWFM